jgi:hypothetical protein
VPSIKDAIAKVEQNWPVYLYFTEYFNENMLPKEFTVRGKQIHPDSKAVKKI